jgi:hypothetical protein
MRGHEQRKAARQQQQGEEVHAVIGKAAPSSARWRKGLGRVGVALGRTLAHSSLRLAPARRSGSAFRPVG